MYKNLLKLAHLYRNKILKLFILGQKAKQVQDMNQTLIDIMRVTSVNLTAQFPRGSKNGHLAANLDHFFV